MKINGIEIEFSTNHPDSPGNWIWKNNLGYDIIFVYWQPAEKKHGVQFYGDWVWNGRSVSFLKGQFVKIEE